MSWAGARLHCDFTMGVAVSAYLGRSTGYLKSNYKQVQGPLWYLLRANHPPEPLPIVGGFPLSVSPGGRAVAISSVEGLCIVTGLAPGGGGFHQAVRSHSERRLSWLPDHRCIVSSDERGHGRMIDARICYDRLTTIATIQVPRDTVSIWQREESLYCLVGDGDAWAIIKRGMEDGASWEPHASGEGEVVDCLPSPDGNTLAWVFSDPVDYDYHRFRLMLSNVDDATELCSTPIAPNPLAWSSDSTKVGFITTECNGIGILSMSGKMERIGYPDNDQNPEISDTVITFSSDGRTVTCDPLWLDQTAYAYDFASSRWVRLEPEEWSVGWQNVRAL